MIEYLGLTVVFLSWIAGGYLLSKWRGSNDMSISQHAATSRQASVLFAVVMSGGGLLFYYWTLKWLVPRLDLGLWFSFLITLAFIGQFVAGLVADVVGHRRRIHRIAAYAMAYLFLPLSVLLINASNISGPARIIGILCLIYMIGSLLLINLVPATRKHYLIYQASYIVAFQLQILSAAYL
jgi:hypothetical protein